MALYEIVGLVGLGCVVAIGLTIMSIGFLMK